MAYKQDITGQTFGRLVVLREAAERKQYRSKWVCRCECGVEKELRIDHLRSGASTSCGCKKLEANTAAITHGMSTTRIYLRWRAMHTRCYDTNSADFKNYGGRGIIVCNRWHNFVDFYADMGEPPEGMTLERKDNDGPYSPDNVCWASRVVQSWNTRREPASALAVLAKQHGITLKAAALRVKHGKLELCK